MRDSAKGDDEPSNLHPSLPTSNPPRQSNRHPCLVFPADPVPDTVPFAGFTAGDSNGLGRVGRRLERVKEDGTCVSFGRAKGLDLEGEGSGWGSGRDTRAVIVSCRSSWDERSSSSGSSSCATVAGRNLGVVS